MIKSDTPLSPYLWLCQERLKGISELPGKELNNPRIVWYHAFTTLKATEDEVPWCSSIICAAAESTGFKSTRSAAAKSWETYGEPVEKLEDAQVGDIVIFKRNDPKNKNARHVTLLNAPIRTQGTLANVIGGNQKNTISVINLPQSEIVAIRRFPVKV